MITRKLELLAHLLVFCRLGALNQQANMAGQDNSNRGFASMDEKKQQEIASKGGQVSGGNFKNDPERASEAGRKGGQS